MTATELVQIITAATAMIAAIGAAISSILNRRKLAETASKVEEVHQATNGMKAQLVATAAAAAHAEGVKAGLELAAAKAKLPPP